MDGAVMDGADMHAPSTRTRTLAQLRNRSKRLYGNADRLQVAYAVATSSGLVHAQELADALSISPPRVRTQLLAFVNAGVMALLPRSGHVQNYERIDDPFWSATVSFVEAWTPNPKGLLGLRPATSDRDARSERTAEID